MATTARAIINLALKKLGVLRAGGEASAADAADALSALLSFYSEKIEGGAFGRVCMIPVLKPGELTAGSNMHLNVLTDEEVNIELPATVPYGYWRTWMRGRDYGWGLNIPLGGDTGQNVPRDKSVVRITDQFGPGRATYVYDAPVQRWMRVDLLSLTDEAPLSARNPDGLASVLATRIVDQFGDTLLSPFTLKSANTYLTALVTNYGSGCDADTYEW